MMISTELSSGTHAFFRHYRIGQCTFVSPQCRLLKFRIDMKPKDTWSFGKYMPSYNWVKYLWLIVCYTACSCLFVRNIHVPPLHSWFENCYRHGQHTFLNTRWCNAWRDNPYQCSYWRSTANADSILCTTQMRPFGYTGHDVLGSQEGADFFDHIEYSHAARFTQDTAILQHSPHQPVQRNQFSPRRQDPPTCHEVA